MSSFDIAFDVIIFLSCFLSIHSYFFSSLDNDWTGTRVSSDQPSIGSCAFLASTGNIEGEWDSQSGTSTVENWDICVSGSNYVSSFDNGNLEGYESGVVYRSGLIGSGTFGPESTSLVFLLNDGTLGNFNWDSTDEDPEDYADDTLHFYSNYRKSTNTPSDADCSRNEESESNGNTVSDKSSSSGAGMLAASILLSTVVLLL
jgi:hypothetical protein